MMLPWQPSISLSNHFKHNVKSAMFTSCQLLKNKSTPIIAKPAWSREDCMSFGFQTMDQLHIIWKNPYFHMHSPVQTWTSADLYILFWAPECGQGHQGLFPQTIFIIGPKLYGWIFCLLKKTKKKKKKETICGNI